MQPYYLFRGTQVAEGMLTARSASSGASATTPGGTFCGGPGNDDLRANRCVRTFCAADPNISLDGVLDGGPGNDVVTRGDGRERLPGGSGADALRGLLGRDRISGGTGADRLAGGGGDDRISGGRGDNTLSGGSGADALSGGTGRDVLSARDRWRDRVACGPGRDRAVVDRSDLVSGCERVRRP